MKKMQREYKVIDFPPLTAEEKATLEEMASRPASEINCDDIPAAFTGGFLSFSFAKRVHVLYNTMRCVLIG